MSDCSKHKATVEKYDGDLKFLAEDIGDLKYDSLRDFLGYLSQKLEKDASKDRAGGREKLATSLDEASLRVLQAKIDIAESWVISEPFMK